MLETIGRCFAALVLLALSAVSTLAQGEAPPLRVATRVVSPLVVDQRGTLTGFSIELWNAIAERLKVKTTYHTSPDVRALLEAVRANQADLGIAAISITSARQNDFDFSQPILNSGLQIMIRGAGENSEPNPLGDLFRLFFSRTILVWLGIALLLILIPAHLIWFLERRRPDGIIPDGSYFQGIFAAMFWAAGTLATQADQMPRHWMARIIAVLWMFSAVVFVAFYTAQLTATLTVQQIQGAINGPEDLPGRCVGTTRGSTATAFLREKNAQVMEFTQIDEAYAALLDKQIDAVVFDGPVLLYHASHGGKGRVTVVGTAFHKEDYGIAFPPDSRWRNQVDGALLSLREDGTYEQIYQKWFGSK